MKENYFEEYNRIASKIKVLRTAKHLTQEQLSELSGEYSKRCVNSKKRVRM